MPKIKKAASDIQARLRTPQGRNLLIFLIFVGISAILWSVLTLNEESQREIRCPVKISHIPDSITIISDPPKDITVSVRAKNSLYFKHKFTSVPAIDIDFQTYRNSNNRLILGMTELRGLIRSRLGNGSQILNVTPDSISLYYTDRQPVKLPLTIDAKVSCNPQFTMTAPITAQIDSVLVYSVKPLGENIDRIYTEPIRYGNLHHAEDIPVKLIAPEGTRLEPSDVIVHIPVEPLISKKRKILVETVNVPNGITMNTFPAQVEVTYLVPMGDYNVVQPDFIVEADYHDTNNASTRRIPLTLRNIPEQFQNVYLTTDSVEYVIERR